MRPPSNLPVLLALIALVALLALLTSLPAHGVPVDDGVAAGAALSRPAARR